MFFLLNMCVVLDLNHGESGSTAGERRMEYAGERSEWAKVAKSIPRNHDFSKNGAFGAIFDRKISVSA